MDELTNQAVDMIFENDALNERIKKKAFPYVLGGVTFNLVLLILLIYIIFKLRHISKVLS
jgi:hypothetical protein